MGWTEYRPPLVCSPVIRYPLNQWCKSYIFWQINRINTVCRKPWLNQVFKNTLCLQNKVVSTTLRFDYMYFSLMTPRADRKFSRESLIRIDQIRLDWVRSYHPTCSPGCWQIELGHLQSCEDFIPRLRKQDTYILTCSLFDLIWNGQVQENYILSHNQPCTALLSTDLWADRSLTSCHAAGLHPAILPIRGVTRLRILAKFFRNWGGFSMGFAEFSPNSGFKNSQRKLWSSCSTIGRGRRQQSKSRPEFPGVDMRDYQPCSYLSIQKRIRKQIPKHLSIGKPVYRER